MRASVLDDGALGVAAVRVAGGVTVAQDESTSTHFDMPRAAIDLVDDLMLENVPSLDRFSLPKAG